jgi:branched-chain amino acid transport system ATP-binding protein
MRVDAGEIRGLIGQNGAGKTSLINAITGIVRPNGGAITFAGRPMTELPPDIISARGIGRTFQHVELFRDETVLDNVLTPGSTATTSMASQLRLPVSVGRETPRQRLGERRRRC